MSGAKHRKSSCHQFGKGGREGLAKIFVGLPDGADQEKR